MIIIVIIIIIIIILIAKFFCSGPAMPDELMRCEGCGNTFAESYLHSKFSLDVCDKCR